MPHFLRTFIAIELETSIREALAGIQQELRDEGGTFRWVDYRAMHLTLKFLGEVDATTVHLVHRAAERALAGVKVFELGVRGLGSFGPKEAPHVIWVGVREGADTLAAMAGAIDRELLAELGVPPERRPFAAHITLGRLRDGRGPSRNRGGQGPRRPPRNKPPRHPTYGRELAGLPELLEKDKDRDWGRQQVERVTVFSSELTRTGPVYSPLSNIILGR